MSEDNELHITPLYVLQKLEEHQEECARRWWAVMCTVIANLVIVIMGMAGVMVTLLTHGH